MELYNLPSLDPVRLQRIARLWVHQSAHVKQGEHVVITYDFPGRQLAHLVARECLELGARVTAEVTDPELDEILAVGSTERDIRQSQAFRDPQMLAADVVFIIRVPVRLDLLAKVSGERLRHQQQAREPIQRNYMIQYTRWQLIYWPTPAEAELEDLPYENYVALWLNAGDQPWAEIEAAQESLVRRLDAATTLELVANPGQPERSTHLKMSLKDMTFINSTIDANFPGSEVFSSPVLDSVNGHLFAEGVYSYHGRLIKDIQLTVVDGRITEARAAENDGALQEILNTDEGARRFGEIAFGTNPGLRRRLFNGLLNEKVGGSFHITPGKAYEDTIADGKHVDNGNRSQIHWDITIMMLPDYGGGQVIVDGEVIQQDGRWLLPELGILNQNL